MGLLNSDLGFQLGQLAGGLWAKNYIERGEDKKTQAAQNAIYDQTIQNWNDLGDLLGVNRTQPPIGTFFSPYHSTPNYFDMFKQNKW